MLFSNYQIWLKGGGSLDGVMAHDDGVRLKTRMREDHIYPDFSFRDEDGDDVTVRVSEIAAFAFRDKPEEPEPAGFRVPDFGNWTAGGGMPYGETSIPTTPSPEVHDTGDKEKV